MKQFRFLAFLRYSDIEDCNDLEITVSADKLSSATAEAIKELERLQKENNIPLDCTCWYNGEGSFNYVTTEEPHVYINHSTIKNVEDAVRLLRQFDN